jgi:hypothetical protein
VSFYNYPEWTEEQKVKFLKQLDESLTTLKDQLEMLAVELDRVAKIADRLDSEQRN